RKVKIPSYVFVAIAAQVYIRKRITESSIFA
ncbi:glutathione-dependent formaldehyde-activating enzyme family protein, partial [Vibrio parahaemolyticus V-223/04]